MENFIDVSEWVPVHQLPGFEACIEYYINKAGEVKSTKYKEDRILKHRPHKAGYPMVCLTQRIGKGKVLDVCVHKLVALAFLGPPPTPYGKGKGCSIIEHKDGNVANCFASNLRWATWKNRKPEKRTKIEESLISN